MSYTPKNSPKSVPRRSPRSVSTESVHLASEILMTGDISNIGDDEAKSALPGVQALRHKAMVDKDLAKIKKCDILIAELNNIIASEPHRPPASSACVSPPRTALSEVKITENEQKQMDKIIDNLLGGCEIDTIDESAIPKLEYALNARKKRAAEDSDYETAKKLEYHLQQLLKIYHKVYSGPKSPLQIKSLTDEEYVSMQEEKLNAAQEELERIKKEFQEAKVNLSAEKEKSQKDMFREIELEINNLESEKLDIEMGVDFKPSKRLVELRKQEENLVKSSRFDEAGVVKKMADNLEMDERGEFNWSRNMVFSKKEKEIKKIHEDKINNSEQYWKNTLNRTNKQYNKKIKAAKRKINAIKAKIENRTGKKYHQNIDSSSEISSGDFDFDLETKSKKQPQSDSSSSSNEKSPKKKSKESVKKKALQENDDIQNNKEEKEKNTPDENNPSKSSSKQKSKDSNKRKIDVPPLKSLKKATPKRSKSPRSPKSKSKKT